VDQLSTWVREGRLRFVLTGAGMMDDNTVIERARWIDQNCEPVLTAGGEGEMGGTGGTLHECAGG
jgi:hypothetical protein